MKMIKVLCFGQENCVHAYEGCKNQVLYSKTEQQIICQNGKITITERK